MDIDFLIQKTLGQLRSRTVLSEYRLILDNFYVKCRDTHYRSSHDELVKLFISETDFLNVLLRLCVLSENDVSLFSGELIMSLRNVDSKIRLIAPEDLSTLFGLLRGDISCLAKLYQIDQPFEYAHNIEEASTCRLPLPFHSVVLDKLVDIVTKADPASVIFPGDKKGFIQLSTISLSCTSSYTFTAWIKSTHLTQETKGFVLFRCRSASGGIDVIMSDKSQDGQWQVIVRSFREMTPGTSTIFKEEVQGTVYIPINKWHLVAVKHTKYFVKPSTISFIVDGVLEWEYDLAYPFSGPTDSQWIIGLGFQGQISSFALYSDSVDIQLLKLQYEQGYNCKTLHDGVRYPQSSFDSGFTTLGSLYLKGPLAHKLVKTNLVFAISPVHFIASGDLGKNSGYELNDYDHEEFNKGLTAVKETFLNNDKIEMTPASESSTQPIIPILSGDCRVCLEESILDYFLSHDGSTSILYTLWGYCSLLHKSETGAFNSLEWSKVICILKNIKSCFKLLRIVLLNSGEIREYFLQIHGFHIIASCLSQIHSKATLIDEDIAHFCIEIIEAFGLDSKRGDCICSALQGLLFDFRVWGNCSITIKTLIVDAISNFTKNGGDMLYKYVGTQRVVDFLRLHIMCLDVNPPSQPDSSLPTITGTVSSQKFETNQALITGTKVESVSILDCIDAGFRLLLIAVESARIYCQKVKVTSNFLLVPEILLNCLNESNSNMLSERLMRVLYQMHSFAPQSLQRSISQMRFADTTCIMILSKSGYTLETRKLALELLFWSLTEEFKPITPQLYSLRKTIQASKIEDSGAASTRARSESNPIKPDSKKTLDLSMQYSEAALPLKRIWEILTVMAHNIEESISSGYWGVTEQAEGLPKNASAQINLLSDNIDYVLDFLSFETASGAGISPWLAIPLLPALLPFVSLQTCQRILLSLNVSLKTDEMQVEAICSFPNRQWMKLIVSLLAVCNFSKSAMNEKSPSNDSEDGFELVTSDQTKNDLSHISITCIELILDTISTIMEREMRYSGNDALMAWRALDIVLYKELPQNNDKINLNKKYLKRCIALVLQRIAKSTEPWSPGLTEALISMLSMIYNNKLCGNVVLVANDSLIHKSPVKISPNQTSDSNHEEQLISFEDFPTSSSDDQNSVPSTPLKVTSTKLPETPSLNVYNQQTEDESQILCFSLDILSNLRKLLLVPGYPKRELKVLKFGLAIVLGSIRVVSSSTADRLSRDILTQIRFMCDPNVVVISEVFNDFIVMVFNQLRGVISDNKISDRIRDRYCALVHAILHYFQDPSTSTKAQTVSTSYVSRTKEALKHIDPNFDIATIMSDIELALPHAGSTFTSLINTEHHLYEADSQIASTPFDGFSKSEAPGITPTRVAIDLLDNIAYDTGNLTFSSGDGALVDLLDSESTKLTTSSVTSKFNVDPITWWKVRQAILSDRIDAERARLNNDVRAYFINILATDKYWRKRRRHLEVEVFYDSHPCHWKLGISHEAQFPSRKRVVLRPSYDVKPTPKEIVYEAEQNSIYAEPNQQVSEASYPKRKSALQIKSGDKYMMDSEELSKSFAKAFSGVIKDVTSSTIENEPEEATDDEALQTSQPGHQNTGSSWGIVDADGSDEGYGIVGVVGDDQDLDNGPSNHGNTESVPIKPISPVSLSGTDDMLGDVRLLETAANEGRRLETGPCLGGTRRILHGPAKYESRIILITASGNIWGTLAFNDKEIYFVSSLEAEDGHKNDFADVNVSLRLRMRRRRWPVSSIGAIYLRRYRLRDTALEVFFRRGKHRSFFADFGHGKESAKNRNLFAKHLMALSPRHAFKHWPSLPIHRLVAEHKGLQEKWINREISNFEYLMMLNTIAGRSFNDLCQYPVFPWILSQYDEATIDLNDPNNYRDLSKPMGAINPTRLQEFLSRYESFHENFGDSEIPAFMYGSHYSTMVGVVLHFLVRLEPFASLHKEMQAGHFDVTDRLFSSIPRTWQHNTNQLSEVKELTPEWFTQPNMFRNLNRYNLGETQDGKTIDDVELPRWANTPEEFINIQARALESEYVSQHLHEWIDLIFGYKQQGPEAVAANNVYYYLTYYGTVNRDEITSESLRQAIELQIAHFGQMPYQLFRQAHPVRLPLNASKSIIPRTISNCFSRTNNFGSTLLDGYQSTLQNSKRQWVAPTSFEEKLSTFCCPIVLHKLSLGQNRNHVIIAVYISNDRICSVLSNGVVEVHKYGTTESAKQLIVAHASKSKAKPVPPKRNSSTPSHSNLNQTNSLSNASTHSIASVITADERDDNKSVADDSASLISFEDEVVLSLPSHIESSALPISIVHPSTPTIQPSISASPPISSFTPSAKPPLSSQPISNPEIEEAIIYLSKDTTHFDIIPRVVLAKNPQYLRSIASLTGQSSSKIRAPISHIVKFTVANQLLISTGFIDGRVGVWELDRLTGFIHSSGDYVQHRCRVVSIATDAIPNSTTDVVASVDQSGVILVWAIAKIRMNILSSPDDRGQSVIFRHPQRLFRCWRSDSMYLDISCNIGVVVCLSHNVMTVYSIERDEQLNRFLVENPVVSKPLDAFDKPTSRNHSNESPEFITKHICLSDSGYVAVSMSCREAKDCPMVAFIATYSLIGERCNVVRCQTELTYFSCPRRGEVLVTGQDDGVVILYSIADLEVLLTLDVHRAAIPAVDPVFQQYLGETNMSSSASKSAPQPDIEPKKASFPPSPIVSVTLGPDPLKPAIICITTLAGDLFVRSLPDYIKWEKNRSPSALSQLVTGHIQAVKGTILQAQNFISSTTESATAIAQNAKQYADEAIGELKKLNSATIWKGVGSLFGMSKDGK